MTTKTLDPVVEIKRLIDECEDKASRTLTIATGNAWAFASSEAVTIRDEILRPYVEAVEKLLIGVRGYIAANPGQGWIDPADLSPFGGETR